MKATPERKTDFYMVDMASAFRDSIKGNDGERAVAITTDLQVGIKNRLAQNHFPRCEKTQIVNYGCGKHGSS